MAAATVLSIRASADLGALTTGAAGTQIRGSEYDGRIPRVAPPRPISGPVPSSTGGAVGVAVGATGGSVDGTSVGATSGGDGAGRFGVMGRPFPPLFPGDGVVDVWGSARKLIRSGSTACSLLLNSEVNG